MRVPKPIVTKSKEERLALLAVARQAFWRGTPEEWLQDQTLFLAQVMVYGDGKSVSTVTLILGEDGFKQVLQSPPSGLFDEKSWRFWHNRYAMEIPPLPQRFYAKA